MPRDDKDKVYCELLWQSRSLSTIRTRRQWQPETGCCLPVERFSVPAWSTSMKHIAGQPSAIYEAPPLRAYPASVRIRNLDLTRHEAWSNAGTPLGCFVITLPAQLVVGRQSNWGLDAVSGLQDWSDVSLCDHAEAVPFGSQAAQGPRRVRW